MDCGTPTNGVVETGARAESAEEVFPLLAAANLARRRGNLAEAERQCREISTQYPESAAVHSLLGEVYEEMNRPDDARACYQLALQLEPNNQGDRERLDRLLQRTQSGNHRRTFRIPRTVGLLSVGRAGFPAGWVAAAILAIICLGMGLALVAPSGSRGARLTAGTAAGSAGESSQEAMIRQSMAAAAHSGGPPITIVSVRVDPRAQTPYALVTVSLDSSSPPGALRDVCVQAAAEAAVAAGAANLSWVTVRVLGLPTGGGASLLFIADTSPGRFISTDISTLTAADSAERFQRTWWNPSLH